MEKQQIVDAIATATYEVFTTMLADEPAPGDPYAQRNAAGMSDGVVAVVGLTGTWVGTGMVTCNAGLACRLSALLVMAEPGDAAQAVNEDVLDSMAEITNMIIGNVKNILEEQFGELNLSIPTVVYGRNLTTRSVNDGEWVVVPFSCHGERLEVKMCLVPSGGRNQLRANFSAALQAS